MVVYTTHPDLSRSSSARRARRTRPAIGQVTPSAHPGFRTAPSSYLADSRSGLQAATEGATPPCMVDNAGGFLRLTQTSQDRRTPGARGGRASRPKRPYLGDLLDRSAPYRAYRPFGDRCRLTLFFPDHTKSNATSPKQDRIGARVPHEDYETLRQAAELSGSTVNQFLVQAALKEARAVIAKEQIIHLSARDWDCLLGLLDDPPAPNPALRSALQGYLQAGSADAVASFDRQP